MSNVIGPFDVEDWVMLRQLRQTIRWMKSRTGEFRPGIKKEQTTFDNILKPYLVAA